MIAPGPASCNVMFAMARAAAVLLVGTAILEAGCGYTIMKGGDGQESARHRSVPLPDLVIAAITSALVHEHWADGGDESTTYFDVYITNIGPALFEGSVTVIWADDAPTHAIGEYNRGGKFSMRSIPPGDTVMMRVGKISIWYPPGKPLRFLLGTDSVDPTRMVPQYRQGLYPVEEVSRENNVFEYVIP